MSVYAMLLATDGSMYEEGWGIEMALANFFVPGEVSP